ncbi:acyltransferase family protein [Actinoalloteichus caeruleus]|uniref:acyltransferase family protein n=1 Tax=Actinoalloteichus cyanogriseus TaxID=2893586 RepID=UPI003BB8DB64
MRSPAYPTSPRPPTGPGPSHVPALDGLRGAAVTGVLLFHTGAMPGGFLGVDLFLVLSGFLITGLLLREVESTGRIALVPFWGRRLRRLFPALALVLAGVTLVVWVLERLGAPVADRGMVSTTLSDALWSQSFLVNWHLLAQDASYWDAFGQSRVFGHLWSIAVEEQFYLVWPVLVGAVLWAVSRFWSRRPGRSASAVFTLTLAGAGVSLLLMIMMVDPADPTRVYTGTDTRAFSLLLGGAAATAAARRWFQHLVEAHHALSGWLIGTLALGILVFWVLADGTATPGLFTGGLFGHAAACAVLVGLCAAVTTSGERDPGAMPPSPLPVRVLRARAMTWVGGISYSLYLWHWPVIVLMPPHQYPALPAWAHATFVIGISLALAVASKRLVEDPIRFRARWARGRTGLVLFGASSAALLLLWFGLPAPSAPPIDIDEL